MKKENKYSCFMYHKELGARIFHSKEEVEKLEKEWVDSPAAFEKKEEVKPVLDKKVTKKKVTKKQGK